MHCNEWMTWVLSAGMLGHERLEFRSGIQFVMDYTTFYKQALKDTLVIFSLHEDHKQLVPEDMLKITNW